MFIINKDRKFHMYLDMDIVSLKDKPFDTCEEANIVKAEFYKAMGETYTFDILPIKIEGKE